MFLATRCTGCVVFSPKTIPIRLLCRYDDHRFGNNLLKFITKQRTNLTNIVYKFVSAYRYGTTSLYCNDVLYKETLR